MRRTMGGAWLAVGAILLAACGTDGTEDAEPQEAELSSADAEEAQGEEGPNETAVEEDAGADEDDADDTGTPSTEAQEVDERQQRLVIADASSPTVVFLDLTTGDLVGEIVLDAPVLTHGAALTSDGRFLLAPHEEQVSIIDGGAWSVQHGSHAHHYVAPPALIGTVDGPAPSHLVSAADTSALYFDGSGDAVLLDEEDLGEATVSAVRTIETGLPHHGFAIPTAQGDVIVTIPDEDMGDLPDVVGVIDADGGSTLDAECVDTHGEAALPNGAAAACEGGVLLLQYADGWSSTFVEYPEVDDEDPYGFPEPRAWTLGAPAGTDHLVATMGTRHVLSVDPQSGSAEAFDLGVEVALFGVTSDADGGLLVLAGDGVVRRLDPATGEIVGEVAAVEPFNEGDTSQPFSRLVRSGDHAYVSDPAAGTIVEIALDGELAVGRTFELEVTPGYLGVVNG
jgi:hypothetical protein